MKFVTFQSAACNAPVSVQVSLVQAVGAKSGKELTDWIPDQSVLVMGADAIEVVGSVAEVVAALESATAPPVAAAVEVAPTDLERAAIIVDLLAAASETEDGELWTCFGVRAVDAALGLGDCSFDDTSRALRALAAKLRGGR